VGRACRAAAVLLLGCWWLAASLEARSIYRYVDENGVVNLTDRRPTGVDRYEVVLKVRPRKVSPPDPETAREVMRELAAAARKYGVDPALVQALAQVESRNNPKAVSPAGAIGVMQLIPATAERYGVKDAFDYRENIDGGVRYLRDLLKMFDGDIRNALAAYNAGEQRVKTHGGIPPIDETRNYVDLVVALFEEMTGRKVPPAKAVPRQQRRPARRRPVRKFVDAQGVVHMSNRP
jgi:soluble lytic murein transglycosylase-like protein